MFYHAKGGDQVALSAQAQLRLQVLGIQPHFHRLACGFVDDDGAVVLAGMGA